MDFHPVHLQTEEIYNTMSVLYDDTAEGANDKTTATFADDNVALLEKQIWMLGEMVK